MDATRLGVLMNVRGLMELVVLNVGLDLGLVSPPLYTMMVLMALATTVMAVPLMRLLAKDGVAAPCSRPRYPGNALMAACNRPRVAPRPVGAVRAAEEWPQFRGVMAGVGVDHPDLPDTWRADDERVVGGRRCPGWDGARRSCGATTCS